MLEAALQFVLEVVCGVTGHVVLCAVTLGRWKPFQRREQTAAIVGLIFWIGLVMALWRLFWL